MSNGSKTKPQPRQVNPRTRQSLLQPDKDPDYRPLVKRRRLNQSQHEDFNSLLRAASAKARTRSTD